MTSNQDPAVTQAEASVPVSNTFQSDVIEGLKHNPKKLSSKYFYDKNGDGLFQSIMIMPEYYLTRCELEIFSSNTSVLTSMITQGGAAFDLVELGAGDAMKSIYLLRDLVKQKADFTYMPIDISGNILCELDRKLNNEIPELETICLEGEYFEMLDRASSLSNRRKVVMFLGSNIGNMEIEEAYSFCRELNKKLNPSDLLLIGFDLKKNPHTILDAYNDKTGLTAAFNLNLLSRINRELGSDFKLDRFRHYQTYDPISGACRSYLISLVNQYVMIGNETIHFAENEAVKMEVSQKFSKVEVEQLAQNSGFDSVGEISDSKGWFVDTLWKRK